jgi:hypothetical protein
MPPIVVGMGMGAGYDERGEIAGFDPFEERPAFDQYLIAIAVFAEVDHVQDAAGFVHDNAGLSGLL